MNAPVKLFAVAGLALGHRDRRTREVLAAAEPRQPRLLAHHRRGAQPADRHGGAHGRRRPLYVAEWEGRVRAIRNGAVDPTPVLDISRLTERQRRAGLPGPRLLARRKPPLRRLHRSQRRLARRRVRDGSRWSRRPRVAAADPVPEAAVPEPQRRAARVRTRRLPVHRVRRRRQWRRSAGQRPEPEHLARQDPAHRSEQALRRPRIRHPGRQPVRERRRAPGDLGLRAAQPVALHVRQGHRRPLDRGRGSGQVRRDRLQRRRQRQGRREGCELRLEPVRGQPRLPGRRKPRRLRVPRLRVHPLRRDAASRAATATAAVRCRACRARTCSPTTATTRSECSASRAAPRRRSRR